MEQAISHPEDLSSKRLANHSGTFTAKNQISIQWKTATILSPVLAAFKKDISDLACQVLAPVEVEFLKAFPQAASQEMFLKSCEPLLANGADWTLIEDTIAATLKQFYLMDLSRFPPAVIQPLLQDVYFLASIEENETLSAFALFAMTPGLPPNHVKLVNLVVSPQQKERGLDRLLLGSLFKLYPKTERVFLFNRPTNTLARAAYEELGFQQDPDPVQDPNHPYNPDFLNLLDYRAERSNLLQETDLR